MNRAVTLLAACVIGAASVAGIIALLAWLPAGTEAQNAVHEAALENGGFEGSYLEGDSADRMIAPSWSLWYTTDWPDEENIRLPKAYEETGRKHGGDKAQAVAWSEWHNFDACLYQQVAVTVGDYVRFSAWVLVETDLGDGDMQTRVGIDPAGGTNPLDIQYETHPDNWDPHTTKGQWQQLSVVMMATSPTATVYACAHPRYAMSFHAYWDDAEFSVVPERQVYVPLAVKEHCMVPPGTLWNANLEQDYCTLHGYQPISGYGNVYLAPFWKPFWNTDFVSSTAENRQPEYNVVEAQAYPYRVHSGAAAQQMGTSGGGSFEAGIYQVVTGTNAGDVLRFSIWGLGWNQHWPKNDPDGYDERVSDYQEEDGLRFRAGIDPYGGESFTSTDIVWSDLYNPFDAWHRFEVTATAQTTRVSVWTYAHPANYQLKSNQVFWDGANLEVTLPE